MDLFDVKNRDGEVVGSFTNKKDAKTKRNELNLAAGQTKNEMLFTPKFRVSPGKDYTGSQYAGNVVF